MKKIFVTLHESGMTYAHEQHSQEQYPDLQESYPGLLLKTILEKGIDPKRVVIELPSGRRVQYFSTGDEETPWNWEVLYA